MAEDEDCCEAVFEISPVLHKQNRKFIEQKTEFGGNTDVDYNAFTIHHKSHKSGKYDRVEVPDGTVTWHSHPGKCLNRNACAIGLPSPMDLSNIYGAVKKGVIWHLVYSKEGCFAIKVRQDYRDVLKTRNDVLEALRKRCMKDFMTLHNRFKRRKDNYTQYTRGWFALAARHGFIVKFFKGITRPKLTIRYPCAKTQKGQARKKAPPRHLWT